MTVLDPSVPRFPLGLRLAAPDDPGPAVDTWRMPPGATLLLVTDGVTEARDAGGVFYDPRASALAGRRFDEPHSLVDALTTDVNAWTGKPAPRRHGRPGPSPAPPRRPGRTGGEGAGRGAAPFPRLMESGRADADALTLFRERPAPGGTLVVVGLSRARGPVDHALGVVSTPLDLAMGLLKNGGRRAPRPAPPAPRPPDMTFAAVAAEARRVLPGARLRRRLFWRCTLV